jgi:hypothetical protein
MEGNLIENSDESNVEVVNVGDSNRSVSIKVYQDIYHQVTGRTEQIRKRHSELLLIDFSEVEQLHIKMTQLCDVHKIVASNLTVSIFHEKERKEQFTSFERFAAYNSNTTSPTVNLVLKYSFSIIPAGINKTQEYTITIKLTSRITLAHQMDEESPPFMRGRMLKYILESPAEITIDYVDYVIARGFLESFDEWVRGCKLTQRNKYLEKMQEHSHVVPQLFKFITISLIAYFALTEIPNYFSDGKSIEIWARFAVIYAAGTILLSSFASMIGTLIERAIDNYPLLSYLNFNKGDLKMIDNFKEEKKSVIYSFIWSSVLTLVLAIIATKLERLI